MSASPDKYQQVLKDLIGKIQKARAATITMLNGQLLTVYWHIGQTILQLQEKEGWGTKVIDRIAADLSMEFPDFKGLSVRNLKYMLAFARTWPEYNGGRKSNPKKNSDHQSTIVQAELAQLPWYHHITLLDKVKERKQRIFYVRQANLNGWKREEMVRQIQTGLYHRAGKSISNFNITLPVHQSDLAQQATRNPYVFDFLGIGENMRERELEDALIQHLKKFMLELGKGFAWVGNQHNLVVQGDDYYLDLLFYNFHLHCFVVFELKISDFKPEFIGKLNFYMNTINQQLKQPNDHPTIGILLCKTPNETVVRYSLEGIDAPIGVSNYRLETIVPPAVQSELPSMAELQREVEKRIRSMKRSRKKS